MYYIKPSCPICRQGAIGFVTCSDKKTIVLISDECDATWLNPSDIRADNAIFPQSPEFFLEEIHCAVGGPNTALVYTRRNPWQSRFF